MLALALTGACEGGDARANSPMTACRVVQRTVALPTELGEASGAAWSTTNPGAFWSHNDSGGDAEIFLVPVNGAPSARLPVEGVRIRDWEDAAIAPCPEGSCLILADIGDNRHRRNRELRLFVVPEPAAGATTAGPAREHSARYPDGRPRDAEAIFALPDGSIYLITKGDDAPVELYRWPTPLTDQPAVLQLVRTLAPEPEQPGDRVTGAGASPNGRYVAVRSYGGLSIYRTEQLLGGGTAAGSVDLTSLGEAQGEGVTLDDQGRVILVSESGSRHLPGNAILMACGRSTTPPA